MLDVLISLILENLEITLVKVESKLLIINNAYVMRKWEKQILIYENSLLIPLIQNRTFNKYFIPGFIDSIYISFQSLFNSSSF